MALFAGSFTENFRFICPQSDAFSLKYTHRIAEKVAVCKKYADLFGYMKQNKYFCKTKRVII